VSPGPSRSAGASVATVASAVAQPPTIRTVVVGPACSKAKPTASGGLQPEGPAVDLAFSRGFEGGVLFGTDSNQATHAAGGQIDSSRLVTIDPVSSTAKRHEVLDQLGMTAWQEPHPDRPEHQWWVARTCDGKPLAFAIVVVDREWALLEVLRSIEHPARYLLHTHIVGLLTEAGVRYMSTVSPTVLQMEPNLRRFQRTLGYRVARTVQVPAGRTAPIKVEFPNTTIDINAIPWAEVWIDGEKVGDTPIGRLAVSIGPHEIVFRHPDFGEQRHALTVTLNTPARLSVDMRKR